MGSGGRLKSTEAIISDESGNIKITWFGQSFLARTIKANSRIAVSGKATVYRGHIGLQSPDYDILNDYGTPLNTSRHVPVYPLTNGITLRNLRRFMWQCLNEWLQGITDHIPHEITQRCNLMPLSDAISQAHFPTDELSLTNSRRRLAFDELFTLQVAVLRRRAELQKTEASISITPDQSVLKSFEDSLSFPLTPAQKRCIDEIISDLSKGVAPMNRLLQGEVGSGKTIVTLAALIATITSGYQGSIMVPTEVLAEQHFQTIKNLFNDTVSDSKTKNILTIHLPSSDRPMQVALLTGSTRARAKSDIIDKLKSCEIDLVIGTHTLIESEIEIPNLGLAVMDEQHRFGVLQRSELKQKGSENPHSLIMSATPIPRTLNMALAGIRDLSTMDSAPEARLPVKTFVSEYSEDVIKEAILREMERGGQIFYLHNRVRTIHQAAAEISKIVPQARIMVGHGQMAESELEDVMMNFANGEADILVCTTIIESGLDMPNVNTLILERADRFGLAQLYQLRGRVGRSEHRAYAYLMAPRGRRITEAAEHRLQAILEASELGAGFRIAMRDLEIRGAGNILGASQSGHIQEVGLDLYTQLLNEAVRELEGEGGSTDETEIPDDLPRIELPMNARIPENYVDHLPTRLAVYQRLAKMTDADYIPEIRDELRDRFGPLPEEVENLLTLASLRALAADVGVESIVQGNDAIVLSLRTPVGGAKVPLQRALGPSVQVGNTQMQMPLRRLGDEWLSRLTRVLERFLVFQESVSALTDPLSAD